MGGNRTHSLVGYGSSSDDSSTHDNLKEGPSAEYANQIAVILNRHEDRLANLEAHSTEIVTAALQGINIRPKHAAPNDDTTAGYDALAHRLESLELMLGSGLRQTNEHRIELQDLQDWRSHIENQQGNDRKQKSSTEQGTHAAAAAVGNREQPKLVPASKPRSGSRKPRGKGRRFRGGRRDRPETRSENTTI